MLYYINVRVRGQNAYWINGRLWGQKSFTESKKWKKNQPNYFLAKQSRFSQIHKIGNNGININFVGLANVKININGFWRCIFSRCSYNWSCSFLMADPKQSWQYCIVENFWKPRMHTTKRNLDVWTRKTTKTTKTYSFIYHWIWVGLKRGAPCLTVQFLHFHSVFRGALQPLACTLDSWQWGF